MEKSSGGHTRDLVVVDLDSIRQVMVVPTFDGILGGSGAAGSAPRVKLPLSDLFSNLFEEAIELGDTGKVAALDKVNGGEGSVDLLLGDEG